MGDGNRSRGNKHKQGVNMLTLAKKQDVVLQMQVQDFIGQEMVLLDGGHYGKWLQLFDSKARYCVPANYSFTNCKSEVMQDAIDDDYGALCARVHQLQNASNKINVSHVVTSVTLQRVIDKTVTARAAMLMFKRRHSLQYVYTANCFYELKINADGAFSIVQKVIRVDNHSVINHGAISTVI